MILRQHFQWATFRRLEQHAAWLQDQFASPSVVRMLMDRATWEVIRP